MPGSTYKHTQEMFKEPVKAPTGNGSKKMEMLSRDQG